MPPNTKHTTDIFPPLKSEGAISVLKKFR